MEELPTYYDVIVVGTGMPECIIAAAVARVGKSVLHLERNSYYGGDWASFSFDRFLEWIEETKAVVENPNIDTRVEDSVLSLLTENERLASCRLRPTSISNLTVKSYVSETARPTASSIQVQSDSSATGSPEEENCEILSSENNGVPADSGGDASEVSTTHLQPEWSVESFIENRRKFNIDLSPKLMFSRGSLVELLISSNIARYAEFQCVNKVLTYINNHIEQVPCSRADVFSTKNVTVVEKRMLMKFLTFCLKFEEHEEEYRGFEDVPFSQFLQSKKLTSNVEHYILHAIAMVDKTTSTLEGLKSTQKFLQSLGRYGKSPFLCTCYGSGELPQCFCRLCAVYGGLYYLNRNVEAVVLDDRCRGVISMNQRLGCQWLVMESSYCPPEFLPSDITKRISKGIFITDKSLYPSEKNENILLKLPPGPSHPHTVTVLEFSSKTYVCPEDLYIVYMICHSVNQTAEEDLLPVSDLLFCNSKEIKSEFMNEECAQKPQVLWSVFFNQMDTSNVDLNSSTPEGLFVTSTPDADLDYENAVKEARAIFEKMYPDEEFLPRAPDPEDILIERHNDNGTEVEKIENDVTQPQEEITHDSLKHSTVENTQPEEE